MIAIVILAAGTSSRLGRPKQLLDLDGEPLLRHTVRHALASNADRVVLVLGSRASEIAAAVGDLGQQTVRNPVFAEGQSTSLKAGIAALPKDTDAVVVMLGDQPMVSPQLLDQLIDQWRQSQALIVQPTFAGKPGHPVMFGRALFPELLTVTGDIGAREIIRAHPQDLLRFPVTGQTLPGDVDTEEDYQQLQAVWPTRQSSD